MCIRDSISTFVKKYLLASVSKPGCTIWQSLQKLLTTVTYNDYNERKTTAIIANLSCNLLQNNNTAYAMFVNVVDTARTTVDKWLHRSSRTWHHCTAAQMSEAAYQHPWTYFNDKLSSALQNARSRLKHKLMASVNVPVTPKTVRVPHCEPLSLIHIWRCRRRG